MYELVLALASFALPSTAPVSSDVDPLEGLSSGERTSLRAAWDESRHAIRARSGGFGAYNFGQRWFVDFDGRGFEVRPSGGDWSWGLELVSYGRAGEEVVVSVPRGTTSERRRLTYDWDTALDEWFVNDSAGLEHGFTVHTKPASSRRTAHLVLTFAVRGGLEGSSEPDGASVSFHDAAGATVLNYAGLKVFDADGRDVPARLEAACDQVVLLVDDRAARYPLTIDPIAQEAYLKSFAPDEFDTFGESGAAVSGDTVVISSFLEASSSTGIGGDPLDDSANSAGAVYVFVRNGSVWSEQAYIKASNTQSFDRFGFGIDLSGDTLVVGAPLEDSGASGVNGHQLNNSIANSGAVYVFVRTGTTWTQEAYLKASNTGLSDQFGSYVAISGDTIAVSAPFEDSIASSVNGVQDNDLKLDSGAVYVFVRNGTTWSQQAYIKASNSAVDEYFGFALDLDGDTLVVGAPEEDSAATGVNGSQNDNSAFSAGAAYVFERTGFWSQTAYLKASNTDPGDDFGASVAVSGNTIVVGAPGEDSGVLGVNGNQTFNNASSAGAAYVFVKGGGGWQQQSYLKASNTDNGDGFGGVAIDGDVIVVGAGSEDGGGTGPGADQSDNSQPAAGAAYVFERLNGEWAQRSYLKASNVERDDFFGNVAVGGDLIVSTAFAEDSRAAGVNGNQTNNAAEWAGAGYVFRIPEPLEASSTSISLSAGGSLPMVLDAGPHRADWTYWMFGSATGTSPGIPVGVGLTLPLNIDAYFNLTLAKPFLAVFGGFLSVLDGLGTGFASLNIPAGADPSLSGVTLNHAYVAGPSFGAVEFVSNAVSVMLVP